MFFTLLAVVHAVLECLKFMGVIVILMDWLGDPEDDLVKQINAFAEPVIQPFEKLAQLIAVPPHFSVSLFMLTVLLVDQFVQTAMKFA